MVKICPYVSRGAFGTLEVTVAGFSLSGMFQRIAIIIGMIKPCQLLIKKARMAAPDNTNTVIHIGEVIIKNTKAANLVIL